MHKNLQKLSFLSAFSKICKNKNLEADLIMYVIEIPYNQKPKSSEGALYINDDAAHQKTNNYTAISRQKLHASCIQYKLPLKFTLTAFSLICKEFVGLQIL